MCRRKMVVSLIKIVTVLTFLYIGRKKHIFYITLQPSLLYKEQAEYCPAGTKENDEI